MATYDVFQGLDNEQQSSPEKLQPTTIENGVPVHDIRKSYSTTLKKSGITNFRFHDLRHAFASQLIMSGID